MNGRPPRIGFDAHVLNGKFQGTRTTVASLLRAVAPRLGGRRLTVYSGNSRETRAMLGADGFDYADLGEASSIRRLLRVFPRLFRRDGIDVGVFQYISPLRGRNIVFVHDILPLTHPRYFSGRTRLRTWAFYSLSILRAAAVVTVSDHARAAVAKRYRLPARRLRTIHNGPSFPPDAYAGERRPSVPRYVMTVGRIERRKNIALLAEAFLRADLADVKLRIVGTTDNGFDFRLPDDPRVEQLQGLDDVALIDLYRGASLFVYPSAAEGFGMPLLDATLFGLPTLSSDATSMPEVGGGLAEYFDPEAPGAVDWLADRIRGHFTDQPVAAPTAEQRAAQAARFSWDAAAASLLELVDELAA